jgi:hypothetical protein
MCRAAGIHDLAARVPRSRNKMNTIKATYQALRAQRLPDEIAEGRGRKLVDVRKVYYGGVQSLPDDYYYDENGRYRDSLRRNAAGGTRTGKDMFASGLYRDANDASGTSSFRGSGVRRQQSHSRKLART